MWFKCSAEIQTKEKAWYGFQVICLKKNSGTKSNFFAKKGKKYSEQNGAKIMKNG